MLLRLIKIQAHRVFLGAVAFPSLVLLISFIRSLWGEAGWLYYGIVYWVFFWVPGIYFLSWVYSLIVTPLWVKILRLSFEIRFLVGMYLCNALLAGLIHIILFGGVDEILRYRKEQEFINYLILLSLLLLSITWFMVGGLEEMKNWRRALLDFWRGD